MEFFDFLAAADIATIIGLIISIGVFVIMFSRFEKNRQKEGMSRSDYFYNVMLEDHSVNVIVALLFINAAEAIFAATMPINESMSLHSHVNVWTRLISHFAIMGTSIVFMFEIPIVTLNLVEVLDANSRATSSSSSVEKKFLTFIYVVKVFMAFLVSFGFPFVIFGIIVLGLGKGQFMVWWFQDLFGPANIEAYYAYYSPIHPNGLPNPETFNIFRDIGIDFYLAGLALTAHITLGMYDAFKRYTTGVREETLQTYID
jgi:hypothetical protein